jgi:hypothetical protein
MAKLKGVSVCTRRAPLMIWRRLPDVVALDGVLLEMHLVECDAGGEALRRNGGSAAIELDGGQGFYLCAESLRKESDEEHGGE